MLMLHCCSCSIQLSVITALVWSSRGAGQHINTHHSAVALLFVQVRVSLMPDQGETFDGDLFLGLESWW
jgi:hypothetical protein